MLRYAALLGLFLLGPARAWQGSAEQEIRAVLARQSDAWNRGDVKGYMEGYSNTPSTIFVGKEVQRGYQQVLERYLVKYPTPAKMGHLTFSDVEVHLAGPADAWVLGRWHLKRTRRGGGDVGGVYTLVFHREAVGWRIVLDHTS